jgi:outer membrane protein assembly factor BamE (lipoprotein component of BamABCDE complex)
MQYKGALILTILTSICSVSCSHEQSLHSVKEQEMTLGVVQKELRKGMSPAEVVGALGSPNMVTRDQNGLETWVYDKIATQASYSQSKGGFWLLIGGYERDSGAHATTQKTLTVVIKFDAESRLDNVTYHASKF